MIDAGKRVHTEVASPMGELTLVADSDGALTGLYLHRQLYRPAQASFGARDPGPFGEATRQLAAYFAGELTAFTVPLAPRGTPFQRMVWQALLEVPYGETTTYRELAERIGRPTAARAVGAANGRNPIGIVVPCHRVLGSAGGLTGYGGGIEWKRWLLALEGASRSVG